MQSKLNSRCSFMTFLRQFNVCLETVDLQWKVLIEICSVQSSIIINLQVYASLKRRHLGLGQYAGG